MPEWLLTNDEMGEVLKFWQRDLTAYESSFQCLCKAQVNKFLVYIDDRAKTMTHIECELFSLPLGTWEAIRKETISPIKQI